MNVLKIDNHQNELTTTAVHPSGVLVYLGERTGYGALWDVRVKAPILDFNTNFGNV